jgi:hypothetical protein
MDLYSKGAYKEAAAEFDKLKATPLLQLSSDALYNGACIYSLNGEIAKSFEILEHLVSERDYSNINHITSDTDLNNLHEDFKWQKILQGVKENIPTPEKTRQKITQELLKAKKILDDDNGKLWGKTIWSDQILVFDVKENTAYSITPFPDSKTDDNVLYYAKLPANTLSPSNSAQDFKGKKYAVVLTTYLSDNSSTIIHELFHILQYRHILLNGNPINYLDSYDAREWLRLEYQALRNCLNAIDSPKSIDTITQYLNDAMLYRKLRQQKYTESLTAEIEIETSEGMAN